MIVIDPIAIAMIHEYLVPGCVSEVPEQFEKDDIGSGWKQHHPGTFLSIPSPTGGLTELYLGLPKGFTRSNSIPHFKPLLFVTWEEFTHDYGKYDMFNVPVWKYLDANGNTLVRGLSPRVNMPFLHIFHGDQRDRINCYEITIEDLSNMD